VTNAVIYIPAAAAHLAVYADQCLAHCAARGYDVAGIVNTGWAAVVAVLASRAAQVVVVARPDHLDPDRVPRIEIAGQPSTPVVQSRNAGPGMTSGSIPRRLRRPNQV
jgi:hypothetical protein